MGVGGRERGFVVAQKAIFDAGGPAPRGSAESVELVGTGLPVKVTDVGD